MNLEVSETTHGNMRLRHDASCITLVKRAQASQVHTQGAPAFKWGRQLHLLGITFGHYADGTKNTKKINCEMTLLNEMIY